MKELIGILMILLSLIAATAYGEDDGKDKNVKQPSSEWIDVNEKPTFFDTIEVDGVKQTRYISYEDRKKKYEEYVKIKDSQSLKTTPPKF